MWQRLRDRQLSGLKFRRQHPIGPFIVDLACVERKLVVEIDGGQHAVTEEGDLRRTDYLEREGWRVLRFWNNEVLLHTEAVLNRILLVVAGGAPSPCPLPRTRWRG